MGTAPEGQGVEQKVTGQPRPFTVTGEDQLHSYRAEGRVEGRGTWGGMGSYNPHQQKDRTSLWNKMAVVNLTRFTVVTRSKLIKEPP